MKVLFTYLLLAVLMLAAVVGLAVGIVLGPLVYGMVRGYEVVAEFMDRHSES